MDARAHKILLIVGGGIAAYKALELIRLLTGRGVAVQCVLTRAGAQFVTPLSLQALSGAAVHTDLFSLTLESEMGHIALSRSADLLVVCPATADLMARMAGGHANNLASTLLLATDKPVLIAPAMNVRMWDHAATQANVATLRARGVHLVGPEEGVMACSEFGFGRLSEPPAILEAILTLLEPSTPLRGRRILVTAGPTHEPIDPVRYLANRSSGKQGYAIARALARYGAEVTLVSGPVDLAPPANVHLVRVQTACEMRTACESAYPLDAAICAAAVADWRVAPATTKIKKQHGTGTPALALVENPDILATLAAPAPNRPRLVVGFAAETDDLLLHATEKRTRKGCDWIVANDVGAGSDVMGGDDNAVTLITANGPEIWPRLSKNEVAERLAARIAAALT
jgi:phosphopantothenoylcysteine decarboxylase/phosphopantothenate--cysteine ligase